MRFSPLVDRLYNDGASGWDVHMRALEARLSGEDVIILSVGDPDFSTPEPIVDAAVNALRGGDTHYQPILGRTDVRAAVAADIQARTGVPTGPENVMLCAGTQNALFASALCLLGPGDEVVALDPMYLTYESTFGLTGANLVPVSQPAESGFRPDIAAVEAAITEQTRAIALTTPNNPTGVVMTEQELKGIAELAERFDLWVIADEVYADVVFEGEHVSIASLPGMSERTVTVGSLSKSHAMTGWRVGWAVAPALLVEHFDALQVNINYGLPGFIQAAALEALTEQRQSFRRMRDIYRRRRDLSAAILSEVPELKILSPAAGMYLLVNVSSVAESTRQFVLDLYEAVGVSVIDASAFGESCAGWVRLSFTISDDELAEGCRRLVSFVNQRLQI